MAPHLFSLLYGFPFKKAFQEFPLCHSRLRIQLYLCSGSGCYWGSGSIPRPVQWIKDPALLQPWHKSQVQCRFDSCPGNFDILWVLGKKKVFITSILMRSLERGDKTMRSTSHLIEETCPKSFSLSLLCLFLNIESVIFYFLFGGWFLVSR